MTLKMIIASIVVVAGVARVIYGERKSSDRVEEKS